jgi:Domain of unknown function (DUF4124)
MYHLFKNSINKCLIGLVIGVFFSVAISSAHAEIYKHVKADGSVEFSDTPSTNHDQSITLRPTSTFTPTPLAAPPARQYQPDNHSTQKYRSAQINSPQDQSTVRDNAGNLSISASVQPALKAGHKMVLIDNGQPIAESNTGSFQLANVDRGEHVFSLQIQNKRGKVLIRSKSSTVYLQRTSLIKPRGSGS